MLPAKVMLVVTDDGSQDETVAVVRRETNSWKWPLFQWVYMGALAWILAFITWHGGHWLGWG